MIALLGVESHPGSAAVSILSAAGVAVALTYTLKMQFGHDPLLNLLRERLERHLIHEADGVQLAIEPPSSTTIAPADPRELRVCAQNGWSRERQLIIELRAVRRLSLNSAGPILPARSSITLAAGAAGLLSIPFRAEPPPQAVTCCTPTPWCSAKAAPELAGGERRP